MSDSAITWGYRLLYAVEPRDDGGGGVRAVSLSIASNPVIEKLTLDVRGLEGVRAWVKDGPALVPVTIIPARAGRPDMDRMDRARIEWVTRQGWRTGLEALTRRWEELAAAGEVAKARAWWDLRVARSRLEEIAEWRRLPHLALPQALATLARARASVEMWVTAKVNGALAWLGKPFRKIGDSLAWAGRVLVIGAAAGLGLGLVAAVGGE